MLVPNVSASTYVPTKNVKPRRPKRNPVGKLVTEQMTALLCQFDAATSKAQSRMFLDADWSEGFAFDEHRQPAGPSPTVECTTIDVGFTMTGQLDATRALVPQFTNWLNKCLADLQRTTDAVATVKENRDVRALRVLIQETEVAA